MSRNDAMLMEEMRMRQLNNYLDSCAECEATEEQAVDDVTSELSEIAFELQDIKKRLEMKYENYDFDFKELMMNEFEGML